eukprot:3141772-Pyramimonas_sp.AAC.1
MSFARQSMLRPRGGQHIFSKQPFQLTAVPWVICHRTRTPWSGNRSRRGARRAAARSDRRGGHHRCKPLRAE